MSIEGMGKNSHRCPNCGRGLFLCLNYIRCPTCQAGICGNQVIDPPDAWEPPTPAEREYARSTMPGKATGHVIGWRQWKVWNKRLHSSVVRGEDDWPPREPMIGVDHCRGGQGFGPGVYAWNGQGGCRTPAVYEIPALCSAVGKVALWGPIAFHRKGYRARYAYPVELYIAKYFSTILLRRSLAKAYGIPVYRTNQIEVPPI